MICSVSGCKKRVRCDSLCMRYWYERKERARDEWRRSDSLCYQCGGPRDDDRKTCSACRTKENVRRRDSQMAQLAAIDRNMTSLLSEFAQMQATPAEVERMRYQSPRLETQVWVTLARADREALLLSEEECPWERREGESVAADRAFCVYLDLGPGRSLQKAYQADKGSTSVKVSGRWRAWSAMNDWVERARAYDRYQRAIVNRQNTLRNMRESRRWQRGEMERLGRKSNVASRRYQEMVSAWEQAGLLCQGVTRAGNPCRRKAMAGESFCEAHVRFHPNRTAAWSDGVQMVERLDVVGQPFLVTREEAERAYNDTWSLCL